MTPYQSPRQDRGNEFDQGELSGLSRRALLKSMAVAPLCAGLSTFSMAQGSGARELWGSAVEAYLKRLSRPDHGYAWEDQATSHLTPTFAVIGCYRLLGKEPPAKGKLAEFVVSHHPFHLKTLERDLKVYEYQQIQSLLWLGEDASSFREQVKTWNRPSIYPKQYEKHGYPVFRFELMAFLGRKLLDLPLSDLSPEFVPYLLERRRGNGSFNNTPAADSSDGHVMNTWWGLQALDSLGRVEERKQETVAWLQACQTSSGGFTHQPNAEVGGVEDVAYTRAALCALKLLGASPANRERCLQYLASLANADGGFGNRPGWLSNPMATYDALDAFDTLGALEAPPVSRQARRPRSALPADLQVFTIQVEAHGEGSPTEAVALAQRLKIHLWGAKNSSPAWLARAQEIADQGQVPVTFFVANEEYNTWVDVPGMGTYSHTSDIIAPAAADIGPSLANQGVVSWPQFRERRLDPLQKGGGRLLWQFGENEELTRIFLDDSLQRGGFTAISTFHFGNPDFANSEAFLNQYRGQIPFIALQDAHGSESWWFADMTTGFRTLFLARTPTWEGWLEALKNNWVVAVRHDAVSRFETWMHSGSREVVDFVQQQASAWRWWDNPAIQRPLVSLVALTPPMRSRSRGPRKASYFVCDAPGRTRPRVCPRHQWPSW
ncbi:prenyltransferase/squalene oxidase repeat-containing protein [Singulisphaera sp. Ch08]|uniref:Geranylgeranyl transferase type II subunit beta n=1 Tax=Singulisphaera sp. Ch08 TaxID=3120278 RepID=A0AAU7CRD9_9BACT